MLYGVLLTTGWAYAWAGAIRGQVSDPSGALVARARVTATSQTSRRAITVTTDGHGGYVLPGLSAGVYTVSAEAPGFAARSKPGVRVAAGQTVQLNFKLTVSTAQTQVEVRAQGVQISVAPADNASAVVISGSALQSLADDPDTLASQIQELAGPSVGPNGGEIYIDGFTGGDMPPKSAIREIRINRDPFSAAFDRLGYGRVEILTKPGSSHFHGSGFILGNSSAFNSASPFLANSSQPAYHSLLYGGRLGGPLGKNASFFLSVERRNINRDNLVNTDVLDSNFQPVALVTAVPNPRVLTSVSPRLDYQITQNNILAARYHYFGSDQRNDGIGADALPSQGYTFDRHHHLLQVSDTQILSSRVVNETRFQYLHFRNTEVPETFAPTVQVQGAFTSGGNSDGSLLRNESHYELQNLTSMALGRHYVQFGGFLRDIQRTENTNGNFNGTFTFNSLMNYQTTEQDLSEGMTIEQIQAAGEGPSQFDITTGSPVASVNRLDGALYAQDTWKARSNLTLNYGLRFESENRISDHADWAPRAGLSWGLGQGNNVKTVVRAGFGIFYDRFDDDEMIQAERLNGVNQLSYLVNRPAFFPGVPPISSFAGQSATAPTVYRIAPNLKSPYALESAVSIERQVWRSLMVSLTYLNSRGERQFLSNDVNAPLPGTYDPSDPSSGVRPLGPGTGNVYEYESQGIFRQNQLIANFRVRGRRVSTFGYYVFNSAFSDTAGVDNFPANPWNIAADYGRSAYDVRHRAFLGASLRAPFGIQLYPMVMIRSGLPFSVTLGEDLYGTGIYNSRPALVTPSTPPSDIRVTPYGSVNVNPQPGEAIVPPDTATGPAAVSFNLRLSRTFGLGPRLGETHGAGEDGGPEHGHHHGGLGGRGLSGGDSGFDGETTDRRYALTVSVSAQDLFNHANLDTPVGDINSPLFDQSLELTGDPYSDGGDASRRIDLEMSFAF